MDWIETPGLKDTLENEVPLAAKLLKEGKRHILVRGQPRTGKSHIRDEIREKSGLEIIGERGLINCAALAPNLIDGELFGYKKGAFTDAIKDKKGLLEDMSDPPKVILLEEIGELPDYLQAKLLVFLETGTFMPVGGTFINDNRKSDEKKSTLRIIATSNAPDEKFRPDFLVRFWQVKVPSLPKRREDILYFLENKDFLGDTVEYLKSYELMRLLTYNYPKGITELQDICIKLKEIKSKGNKPPDKFFYLELFPKDYFTSSIYADFLIEYGQFIILEKLFPNLFGKWFHEKSTFSRKKIAIEWELWCLFFAQYQQDSGDIFHNLFENKFSQYRHRQSFVDLALNNDITKDYFKTYLRKYKNRERQIAKIDVLRKRIIDALFSEEKEKEMDSNGKNPRYLDAEVLTEEEIKEQYFRYHFKIKGRSGTKLYNKTGLTSSGVTARKKRYFPSKSKDISSKSKGK